MIQQDTYTRVTLDHLSDVNTYQKVPLMSAKTVENKVNTAWKKICLQNEFPPFVQKSFLVSNTDLPRFYHLIKTHKASPDIKMRPIASNINGPTQRISWLLANALKPLLKNAPAHLENSLELIRCIQDGHLTPPLQTRCLGPPPSHAKQHVFFLQRSSFSPKRGPTHGFQHFRHTGHPV